ncbi:Imm49 family immunity protein [Streptomyces sp. PAM3C]|uniref:Imm49 family immunity protein n=1 Tax=Streptomyces sp. PAM3C TaxID=2847300 RepID=UPI0035ABF74F
MSESCHTVINGVASATGCATACSTTAVTFSSALFNASLLTVDDPAAQQLETWEAWVMAMQVGSALFASATAEEGSVVECVIGHEVRRIPAVGSRISRTPVPGWKPSGLPWSAGTRHG